MSKRRPTSSKKPAAAPIAPAGKKRLFYILPGLLFFSVLIYLIIGKGKTEASAVGQMGAADYCKTGPAFASQFGLQLPVAIDLRQQRDRGLSLMEGRQGGKTLHLPEWEQAGYLGPHAIDRKGNIYVAPAPNINLEYNPPEEQNKVYIVGSQTGKMEKYLDLPWVSPPTANNPFGVVGLTYDCETESLYAASIAGSGFKEEVGRIYRIDLKTKAVMDQLEGVDAIGIGVFNHPAGKRLYFGSAREPEVFSIALDKKGNFKGNKRFEFSLAAQKGGSFDKGHRIQFLGEKQMVVKAIEFSYSLIAASNPKRNIYTLNYDPATDKWTLLDVQESAF